MFSSLRRLLGCSEQLVFTQGFQESLDPDAERSDRIGQVEFEEQRGDVVGFQMRLEIRVVAFVRIAEFLLQEDGAAG